MNELKLSEIESGLVYRNPMPHVKSKHAYFPSVVFSGNGEMLASFVIGEAFEAVNLNTNIAHSSDMGKNWDNPKPLLPQDAKQLSSNCGRLSIVSGRDLVSMVVRSHRELYPEAGLANPETLGFVPTDLLLIRSYDNGYTWTTPEIVVPPIEGPSFEACSRIVALKDGRWIWPTSTWRAWNGYSPNGMKMIALVSHDKGETWPEYMDIMDGNTDNIIFWEGKVLELSNGILLAVSWAYNEKQGRDMPNHFAISKNGGKSWSVPDSTGIWGQTMAIIELQDNHLLTIYRRIDRPGLWMGISQLRKNRWSNKYDFCLWGKQNVNLSNRSGKIVQDFNELKFGAPDITILPDGSVYIVFWCYEQMVSNIRWIKIGSFT